MKKMLFAAVAIVTLFVAGCTGVGSVDPVEVIDRIDAAVQCALALSEAGGKVAEAAKGVDTKNVKAVLGVVDKVGAEKLPQAAAAACARIIKYGIDDAKKVRDAAAAKKAGEAPPPKP